MPNGDNHGPMAVLPEEAPEPIPTNTQGEPAILVENSQPTNPSTRLRKRQRNNSSAFTEFNTANNSAHTGDNNGRVTNQEARLFFNSFKEVLAHQTSIIEAARAEIREIKNEQQVLKNQNAELQEKIQALRVQTEARPVNDSHQKHGQKW